MKDTVANPAASSHPVTSPAVDHDPFCPPGDGPRREFWDKHPGIVWSNHNAGDGVRIRIALMEHRFRVLLDIAVEFGIERLEHEWKILQTDPLTDTRRAEKSVTPILTNIRRGYELASA